MIMNAGNQNYAFGGGHLVQGSLFGNAIPPAKVSFDIDAAVHGLQSVSGWGFLQVGGFSARISITGAIPAAIFPITVTSPTTFSNCDPTTQTCNSEIPLFFTGIATVQSKLGSSPAQIPIAIESPYWNPFGGPIVITSLDSAKHPSIFLVVSYDSATIYWAGVQLQGEISGSLGTESVAGSYGQTVTSWENLVSASESDWGSIAFVGMTDPILNANGGLLGHTTFSLAGSFDCAPEFGLPEGTCTATGATSDGSFWMVAGHSSLIRGTYHTVWSVPSLFTMTTVMGAVTTF